MGSTLLVVGLFASFIPPFIWGLPLFAIGVMMMFGGAVQGTATAAKAAVAVGKEVSKARATPGQTGAGAPDTSLSPADLAKWNSLVELDPDIARAAEQARAYGSRYEMMLAEKYLPLMDKAYLQAALDKVVATVKADKAKA
ncbi:hypothetical protein [Methyloraptor flagellatus]|uniref:Uncharacterized protein n=1 Tax=Methyloraptor flagellatus TaxID=3162530 RepID=A0AAU7XIX2_9HYPH